MSNPIQKITSANLRDLYSLWTIKNPGMLLLDRLGLVRREYSIQIRSGVIVSLRGATSDRFTAYETFVRKVYTRRDGLIPRGGTVVDIGANIGCFTIQAACAVGPQGKVVAVEPMSRPFERLQKNILLNQFKNVKVVCCAATSKNGPVDLVENSIDLFSSLYNSVNGNKINGTTKTVDGVTLEKLCSDDNIQHIDLLKLDCEGAEYDIIFSLSGPLLSSIQNVVAELHEIPDHEPGDIVAYLTGHGFHHYFDETHYFTRS